MVMEDNPLDYTNFSGAFKEKQYAFPCQGRDGLQGAFIV
jgi:hypothetical protein